MVAVFSVHVLHDVVLHNWNLGLSSILGSGGVNVDSITKSEDTLVSTVLQSVWVDINQSAFVSKSRVSQPLVWVRWWDNVGGSKNMLESFSRVNISEVSNFLSKIIA